MYKIVLSIWLLCSMSFCSSGSEIKVTERLKEKVLEAKSFCVKNNLNVNMCILVDMKIHSGKKRLYLWDFKGDSIIMAGVCSHGAGKNGWSQDQTKSNPQFSNVPDSHCSSLGKYKLGSRGYSSFGIHINYKLHGLESTNNNAYKRTIVFHSWGIIDDEETYPYGIAESWGCPAVSNNFLEEIDKLIKDQKKPMLFWIYN